MRTCILRHLRLEALGIVSMIPWSQRRRNQNPDTGLSSCQGGPRDFLGAHDASCRKTNKSNQTEPSYRKVVESFRQEACLLFNDRTDLKTFQLRVGGANRTRKNKIRKGGLASPITVGPSVGCLWASDASWPKTIGFFRQVWPGFTCSSEKFQKSQHEQKSKEIRLQFQKNRSILKSSSIERF